MKKYKIKILILGIIGILTIAFGTWSAVDAIESSTIYVLPAQASKETGDIFNISVKINPSEQKVCVVEGKMDLTKLSCQKITMGSGISPQTSPSCDDLSFLLGIQGCTTNEKTLFTVSVKTNSAGSGTVNFTEIDIIGEGVSISSTSSGGSYTITSPCICGDWSAWQDGSCGGGSCSSTQLLQTRTRLCTPSDCEAKDQYLCKDDSGCISRLPVMETEEEPVMETEEEKEKAPVEEETEPEEKIPQKSLLANLTMAWKEITGSALLIIITILCIVGLVVIGVKEWWAFRKRKEK